MKKHLVFLHSNDIHGDFQGKEENGLRTGGISLLSGFVRKTKREEKNVIYTMGGDLFMGSVIDTEFRGLSTIRFANALQPDVFAIGNHELDYGLSHLLFLEKCADFPIICANLTVRELNRPLFSPWKDLVVDGVKIRFIGLLTESIIGKIQQEDLISGEVSVRDVYKELGRVMKIPKNEEPADITILLTHIGLEDDRILAEKLLPEWKIDMIFGGHSHSAMKEAEVVNGIPIVQAGSGSGQIGRADVVFDQAEKRVTDFLWQLIPVTEENSEHDDLLDFYQERYAREVDSKYDRRLVLLPKTYTLNTYHNETEILDLFADLYQEAFKTDVFLLSSNGVRTRAFGPEVTRRDLLMALPYDNEVFRITMSGERLIRMITYMLRKEAWEGTHVFILFSGTMKIWFDRENRCVKKVTLFGKEPEPEHLYTVGITSYVRKNLRAFLGIDEDELPIEKLAASDRPGIESFLLTQEFYELKDQGRVVFC
ncbi:MAG: bifunctional metallophosphatase/5'-nucleotidase [Lachnospiraceae bacterium]|nr:bifunctional metallophosphatase/5'-nucleotidase [Lachnospiraceae bacterium]